MAAITKRIIMSHAKCGVVTLDSTNKPIITDLPDYSVRGAKLTEAKLYKILAKLYGKNKMYVVHSINDYTTLYTLSLDNFLKYATPIELGEEEEVK